MGTSLLVHQAEIWAHYPCIAMGLKGLVKRRFLDLIDAQITKKLTPFLEMGVGPDGDDVSDFVVDDDGDISIENMMAKTSLVSDLLVSKGMPYRVRMVRCKRIFCDIPWEDMSKGACASGSASSALRIAPFLWFECAADGRGAVFGPAGLDAALLPSDDCSFIAQPNAQCVPKHMLTTTCHLHHLFDSPHSRLLPLDPMTLSLPKRGVEARDQRSDGGGHAHRAQRVDHRLPPKRKGGGDPCRCCSARGED
tara:strand:+ start:429 stop:1181 length:753 start_codon:yes stop_codon:yes gene_type:complete